MALPFLPAKHIAPAFAEMVDALPDNVDERVQSLVQYTSTSGSRAGCGQLRV